MRLNVNDIVGDVVGGVSRSINSVVDAARAYPELMEIARDAGRVLKKIEALVDRLDKPLKELEEKLSGIDLSKERIERLERAVLNIERATAGVEATMGALPRVLRSRIDRFRPQTAGGVQAEFPPEAE
jgi:predicted nuclease with TOPRIM domain